MRPQRSRGSCSSRGFDDQRASLRQDRVNRAIVRRYVPVAAFLPDLILDVSGNDLPYLFAIAGRDTVEIDGTVIRRQHQFEAAASLLVVDLAYLIAAESQRPGICVDSDAAYLARLIRSDDELSVGDLWTDAPAGECLLGIASRDCVIMLVEVVRVQLGSKLRDEL